MKPIKVEPGNNKKVVCTTKCYEFLRKITIFHEFKMADFYIL